MARSFPISLIVLATVLSLGSWSFGQAGRYSQRYQTPSGPVLSPNLQYFRLDPGPFQLGQYLSFVQPRWQVQQALQQGRGQLGLVQSEIHRIGEEVAISPTGSGSVFMNQRAYFGNQAAFYATRQPGQAGGVSRAPARRLSGGYGGGIGGIGGIGGMGGMGMGGMGMGGMGMGGIY